MVLEQKYQEAYDALDETVRQRTRNGRYTALGYTSNLDLLCDFKVERLNELLERHMPDGVLSEMKVADEIETMEDLLGTVVYYCIRGIGGEADVKNTKLVEESFHFDYGMGGTAVQAAMALAQLGCPSIVHLTDDSKEVCQILRSPSIYAVSQDGRLIHTDEVIQKNEQEIHFIIQFKKGDKICLGGQEAVIPCSNRLIITKITVNEFVPFSKPYFEWIERNGTDISSNVLSSFNALLDPQVLKEHLEYVKGHVAKYKEANPDGIVFFEDAHYHDYAVRKLCLETVYSCVDIVSLNEEELKYTLKEMYDFDVDIEDIISCVEGARFIRAKFGIQKGVIVHTKDYSMYVGDPLKADIERGLIYGNLLATAKAKNGWYGTKEQIREVLDFELSPKGVENYEKVKASPFAGEVTLVPSKYIDKPKYTIGLGDSFVGGVQMCF